MEVDSRKWTVNGRSGCCHAGAMRSGPSAVSGDRRMREDHVTGY